MKRKIKIVLNPNKNTKFEQVQWRIENTPAELSFDLGNLSYIFQFKPNPVMEIWKRDKSGELEYCIREIKLKDLIGINNEKKIKRNN